MQAPRNVLREARGLRRESGKAEELAIWNGQWLEPWKERYHKRAAAGRSTGWQPEVLGPVVGEEIKYSCSLGVVVVLGPMQTVHDSRVERPVVQTDFRD